MQTGLSNEVEHVVLVDASNNAIGLADKASVHTRTTPLHRGFSLFLFNSRGQLLLQQRAHSKKTWPGVWSNSVCGHPAQDEFVESAALRRAQYELGVNLTLENIKLFIADYKYRYEFNNVVEHEICPVLGVIYDGKVVPNAAEVADIAWVDWPEFVLQMRQKNTFSEWCAEETQLLENTVEFQNFYRSIKTS